MTVAISFTAMPAYAAEAEGIAISTADDLRAMENNPSGKYYLTRDIEVPENMALFTDYNKPFTGTLDGKGHKLKTTKSHQAATLIQGFSSMQRVPLSRIFP